MHPRATELIARLEMIPHPEGGYYREVYRSIARVRPVDDRPERCALTSIYFLLPAGEMSRWHRVASDEAWHYCEGDALELFVADADFESVIRHVLGPIEQGRGPLHVVAARGWQAARSLGEYTLVACTVGPGFEFADFQMLRDRPVEAQAVRQRHPDVARLI